MSRLMVMVMSMVLWGAFFSLIGATLAILMLSYWSIILYLNGVSQYLAWGVASGTSVGLCVGLLFGILHRIKS